MQRLRFRLWRVRSPLLALSLLLSLPPGNEMFQFPGFAPRSAWCRYRYRRVAPFGNPRFTEYLPLCAAYRSLSRPSSPPGAKASFMCPSLLSVFLSPNKLCKSVESSSLFPPAFLSVNLRSQPRLCDSLFVFTRLLALTFGLYAKHQSLPSCQ